MLRLWLKYVNEPTKVSPIEVNGFCFEGLFLEGESMGNNRMSNIAVAACGIALSASALAGCTSMEGMPMAQMSPAQPNVPTYGQQAANAPVAMALATPSSLTAPQQPVQTAIATQKTDRLPGNAQAVEIMVASNAPAINPQILATPEYFVIPGHVAVPTPRPQIEVASVAPVVQSVQSDVVSGTVAPAAQQVPLQNSATVMARMAPAPQNGVSGAGMQHYPVQYASNNSEAATKIANQISALRTGNELAYANKTNGSAADAIATLLPAQQSAGQIERQAPKKRETLNDLIFKYATLYGVPEHFVHRVAKRESTYNPKAYNSGNYGLMQIRLNTAKGLGYKGDANGLFDAETNLKYAVKYLRGAWLVADGNEDKADKLYIKGYYYDAKRKGLLEETFMK
jgi:soluble lytic murein transglycosylase-like protein